MTGTAVLYRENEDILYLEGIEKSTYEEIVKQSGQEKCQCKLDHKTIDLGKVTPLGFKLDNVDWEYGY
ncbi:hypothetical protein [Bacillus solimangrovi]|uniref:Uncharacterized protein n=1 Tax=Bacillus solimangrovi TaxID=1305675 RepID=A0A1E5LI83_9BACI|nr:hypothetical protein [Bacillus solimangrovi]OEH93799.1 hypothetical protein BFG57_11495 [Bacillus solimangrovi]